MDIVRDERPDLSRWPANDADWRSWFGLADRSGGHPYTMAEAGRSAAKTVREPGSQGGGSTGARQGNAGSRQGDPCDQRDIEGRYRSAAAQAAAARARLKEAQAEAMAAADELVRLTESIHHID